MTPFEKAVAAAKANQLKTPEVMIEGQGKVDYFKFQLANHKFALRILSSGMKMRGVKLKDLKEYYGLTGRSAKQCMEQFDLIWHNYR